MWFLRGPDLHQLAMIATAWRKWGLDDAHERALDRLVRALLGSPGGAGRAWLAVTKDGAVRPNGWLRGDEALDSLRKFIGDLNDVGALADLERERHITRLRLRVLCDPDRTGEILPAADPGEAADRPYRRHWTALDVQFVSDRDDGFQIHLGFSFWATRPPWHPADAAEEPKRIEAAAVQELRKTFELRATAATGYLVDRHFGPATTLVWRQEHAPPIFWVVTLAEPRKDPADYLLDDSFAERLVRPLLGRGPQDGGVAASVINGDMLALRLFGRDPDGSVKGDGAEVDGAGSAQLTVRPVYLLVLGRQQPHRGDQPKDYRHQQVVTSLTEFEALAATDMHRIADELNVWGTHVRVYDSVAQQTSRMWDALALHLPVRKGRDLAAAHRAIALVHQTVLQGVADLAELESQVMAKKTDADELADELADRVDQGLAERPLPAAYQGIAESVTQKSRLSRLGRRGAAVVTDARRVKRQYEDLLASIAHAFDERRVRELDVLQRGNFSLSLAVAGVTIVTVLDFLYNVKGGEPAHTWLRVLRDSGWALLVLLVIGVGFYFRMVMKARHIASWGFRRRYHKALSFLRDSSTKELDLRRATYETAAAGTADDNADDNWEELDRELARRFAELWDEATANPPRTGSQERRPKKDIALLTRDVEQWMLRALLLTERPRRLARYRLPRLTLLYRHCVALERSRRWNTATEVVADADLEATLEGEGYSLVEARDLDQYIEDLARSHDDPPATTVELLDRIEEALRIRTRSAELDGVNRMFVHWAVERLIAHGVRQFIDVGAGLPDTEGVHRMAEGLNVVYVDHAPELVAQGKVLLAQPGRTMFIKSDMVEDAKEIITRARGVLDVGQPMAVLFTRVLGYVSDENVRKALASFRAHLPSETFIVISHVASAAEPGSRGAGGLAHVLANHNGHRDEVIRSTEQIRGFFAGLDPEAALSSAAELVKIDPSELGAPATPASPPGALYLAAGIGRLP
ncbi:MAG TPA: SAM-dependent methyltransferase [Streptosporangiaceae bacterium]